MRLKFDKARDSFLIQAPERVFMLDEPAHAIVSRCDGKVRVEAVIDELCRLYADAPRQEIEADVLSVIQNLVDKGVMVL
jgi:pyrroloquinoline quinone biosynthesis protein D